MATYGLTAYGSDYYGISSTLYTSNPKATPVDFGTIRVDWQSPGGSWIRIRLVRNGFGYAETADDGTVLLDLNCGPAASPPLDTATTTYTDSGLVAGKFYYYSLWVLTSVGASLTWRRSGDVQGLSVTDHAYDQYLLKRLPGLWTNSTREVEGQPSQDTLISRFARLLGYDLSYYRDLADALLRVRDADQIPGNLLPVLSDTMGCAYEPEISMRQNRVMLRNWYYLQSIKGTSLGVTGTASALTGFGAEQLPIVNLMLDDDDATFETGVGHWTSDTSTIDQVTTPTPPVGTGVLRITQGTTGVASARSMGATSAVTQGIPVVVGHQYAASAYFQSAATVRTPYVRINWYDTSGTYLSSSDGATVTTTTTGWTRGSVVGVAPAGAVYAAVVTLFSTMAASEVQYVSAVQFEEIKNLLANPEFDADTSGWTGVGNNLLSAAASSFEDGTTSAYAGTNTTVANTTAQAYDGTHSLSGTAQAAGSVNLTSPTGVGGTLVTPGTLVQAVSHVRASTMPRAFQVQIYFYDSTGSTAGMPLPIGSAFADNTVGWTQGSVTAVVPANAVYAAVHTQINNCAAGEVHYVDAVGLFQIPLIPGGGVNLLDNGDFDWTVSGGWFGPNGATLAVSTDQSYTGLTSALATLPTGNPAYTGIGIGLPANILVQDETYTFSIWAYNPAGQCPSLRASVQGPALAANISGTLIASTDQWVRHVITFTVADATQPLTLYLLNGVSSTAGQFFYAGAAKLEVGSAATPFVPKRYSNLSPNPSFETSTAGAYSNNTSAALTQDNTLGYIGTGSLKVIQAASVATADACLAQVSAQSGDTYTASVYVYHTLGNSQNFNIRLQEWQNNTFQRETNGAFVSVPSGQWTRLTVTATTTGCDQVRPIVKCQSILAVNSYYHADAVQVVYGNDPLPYVDGSLGSGLSWESSNNLIVATDSSFEDTVGHPLGNWSANHATLSNSTAKAADGTHCLAATCTTTGVYGAWYGVLSTTPVAPGQVWTVSAYLACTAASPGTLNIEWYDATSTRIRTDSLAITALSTTMTRYTITALAPDTAAFGRVTCYATGAVNDVLYIDAVQIETRDHATPYGATGTANVSTSAVRIPWGIDAQQPITWQTSTVTIDGAAHHYAYSGPQYNPNLFATGMSSKCSLTANSAYTMSVYSETDGSYVLAVYGPGVDGPVVSSVYSGDANNWYRRSLSFETNSSGGDVYIALLDTHPTTRARISLAQLEYGGESPYASPVAQAFDKSRVVRVNLIAKRVNEVLNPGFDVDTTSWSAVNGATLTRTTTTTYDGGAGAARVAVAAVNDGIYTDVIVEGGEPYAVAAQLASDAASSVMLQIYWHNGGSTISHDEVTVASSSEWTRASLVATSPADATWARIFVYYLGSSATNIYVDDVMCEQSDVINTYFDPRHNPGDVQWEGTVDNSRSHYYPNFSAKKSRLLDRLPSALPVGANYDVVWAQPVGV